VAIPKHRFFLDDHNRVLRVRIWPSGSVQLHLISDDSGDAIALPSTTRKVTTSGNESFEYDSLVKKAAECPATVIKK